MIITELYHLINFYFRTHIFHYFLLFLFVFKILKCIFNRFFLHTNPSPAEYYTERGSDTYYIILMYQV